MWTNFHLTMICSLRKDFSSVDELFAIVGSFIKEQHVDNETAFSLTVAAEELFTNVVKYGSRTSDSVQICLERIDNWLELRITDFGADRFDITAEELPDLDVPIEQRRPGGMGLHLVRSMADSLTYRHENGNGIITFRKKAGTSDVHS